MIILTRRVEAPPKRTSKLGVAYALRVCFRQRLWVLTFPPSFLLHTRFSRFSTLPPASPFDTLHLPAIHSNICTYNFFLTRIVIMW